MGFPLRVRYISVSIWERVLEKVAWRLMGWKTRCLSIGIKRPFLKLITMSIDIFSFLFILSFGVLNRLEKVFRRVLYVGCGERRKIHWVK